MAQPYMRGNHSNNSNNSMVRNSTSSGYGYGRPNRAEETSMTLMEMENNQKWDALAEQVQTLKAISMDIHQEVKSQNSMLDGMGKSFGNATDMFRSTINQMGVMMSGGGGSKHMYYLIAFVVFVFLLLYFLIAARK